jgi:hypothetical protein
VEWLNPNHRLAARLLADASFAGDNAEDRAAATVPREPPSGMVSVELVSKVNLPEIARIGIARLVEPISPATAGALLSYAHVPDLF